MQKTNENLIDKSRGKVDILLSFGADQELDTSLNKLIIFQIAKYRTHMHQIECELKSYEIKYNLTSKEFFHRFESGMLGDAADYFEWSGLYENILLYKERIHSLEAALKK